MRLEGLIPEELLSRSIAYHNPDGRWERPSRALVLKEEKAEIHVIVNWAETLRDKRDR